MRCHTPATFFFTAETQYYRRTSSGSLPVQSPSSASDFAGTCGASRWCRRKRRRNRCRLGCGRRRWGGAFVFTRVFNAIAGFSAELAGTLLTVSPILTLEALANEIAAFMAKAAVDHVKNASGSADLLVLTTFPTTCLLSAGPFTAHFKAAVGRG